jgi:hypothetical protein
MKARRMAAVAALGAAMVLSGTTAAPAGAQTSGTERFTLTATFPQSGHTLRGKGTYTGLVNGNGTFTAGEGDHFGATLRTPKGSLHLDVTSGPSNDRFNPGACLLSFAGTDTFDVVGGTGAFKGATGSGSDTTRGSLVFGRNKDGSCNLHAPIGGAITVQGQVQVTTGR